MNRLTGSDIKLSLILGLFFGWMLSFPFNGGMLSIFSEQREYAGYPLGLIFTLFHAIGLMSAALPSFRLLSRNRLMKAGIWTCCLAYACLVLPGNTQLVLTIALCGLSSGVFISGWSYPYIQKTTSENRISFMALAIITANIINLVISVSSLALPMEAVYAIAAVPLVPALYMAQSLKPCSAPSAVPLKGKHSQIIPILLLCFLVTALYINGGLILYVVYPSFSGFKNLSAFFRFLPYVAVLCFFLIKPGIFRNRLHPLYLSAALLGFSFISYGILKASLAGYLLTEVFNQSAFALLDLYVWTVFAGLAKGFVKPQLIFSLGLFTNVIAIFAGGAIGNMILQIENFYEITAIIAAAAIFLTVLILPYVNLHMETDSIQQINSPVGSNKVQDMIIASTPDIDYEEAVEKRKEKIFSCSSLTSREKEIVGLILEGKSNIYIHETLYISLNTLKTHLRSIYKKLEVSNKHELLSLALDLMSIEEEGSQSRQEAAQDRKESV
ncbi:MAG: hypothetical protein HGA22_02575 [Clostridiales bacterium]|nr:hypothetical protein [Clostridiales bacterium]